MNDYEGQRQLAEPARPAAELWRTVAGFLAASILAALLNAFYFGAIDTIAPDWARAELAGAGIGQTPVSLLALLVSFGLMIVALAAVLNVLHKRSLASVAGPIDRALADFLNCLKIIAPILLVMMLLPVPGEGSLVPHLGLGLWLALLPFALIGLALQVGAEELVFRGYLQQQLSARFDAPVVWMLAPAALFAAGHYDADAGAMAPYIVIWALFFGLAAADLTARAGNIGPAIALHMANNAVAMLIISLPDSFSGLALYHYPYTSAELDPVSPLILLDLAQLGVLWLACRLAIRR